MDRYFLYPPGAFLPGFLEGFGHIGAILAPGGGELQGQDPVEETAAFGLAAGLRLHDILGIHVVRVLLLTYAGEARKQGEYGKYLPHNNL